jgi:tetrahydromethanopterin S-methyltransferase subunit E
MRSRQPDLTSLIAGITFCVIALAYIGGEISNRTFQLRWVAPILLIGLGLAGLASGVLRGRQRPPSDD